MTDQSWDRLPADALRVRQDRLVADWIRREVQPFNGFWAERLGDGVDGAAALRGLAVAEERMLAGAGGPGNPALLIRPTEAGFKRHAPRADLFAAARESRSGDADARRAALFRRYKPAHVHEAGVALVLAVAYTRTDLDRLHLAGARLMEVLGAGADDRLVSAVPAGPSIRFWGLYHAALAARMTALHPRQPGDSAAAAVVRGIAMLPPTVVAAPLAEVVELFSELAEGGRRLPDLRAIITVGPPPDTAVRERLAELARRLGAGPVRVQAVWAPESSRVLWGECRPPTPDPQEATYGLHTYPDMEVVEVRDVWRGGTARPGEDGEIVLTSLGWRGTALLRFATGSWTGGLVEVQCPNCRRTVPRLSPLAAEAAWQPRVERRDGKRVRVDLRRATPVLAGGTLERLGARDWSLRAVGGSLVLGLDAQQPDREALVELAESIGRAVGVVPVVRLGAAAAAARPRLGDAGRPAP